ncbi:unnamed protein product [Calypogeia fissa]
MTPGTKSDPSSNRKAKAADSLFSQDSVEDKFIVNVGQTTQEAWTSDSMPWNTIHGIPWKRCEMLGEGTYGTVYLGMRQDNKLFAVKSIYIHYPASPKAVRNIECQIGEIKMMRHLKTKYAVRWLGCGKSNGDNGMEGNETLDVFLEYVVRGSLKHVAKARKKPFEENPYIKQYTYDILKALQYMKKAKIVHGDIKMANLLLSGDCVKLADWGGAKRLNRGNLTSLLIGTQGFMSPEVLKKQRQSYPADIFSLGCTVIEMLTRNKPNQVLKVVKVQKGQCKTAEVERRVPQIPASASPELKDFLEQCFHPTPQDRWTATELLHHPFIGNRDKKSALPYSMAIPDSIGATCFNPHAGNRLSSEMDL